MQLNKFLFRREKIKTLTIFVLLLLFYNNLFSQELHDVELRIAVVNMPSSLITCTSSAVNNTVWNAYYEIENSLAPTYAIAAPNRPNFDFQFIDTNKYWQGRLFYAKYKMQVLNAYFYIDYRSCNLCSYGDLYFTYDYQNDRFYYNNNNINGTTVYAFELLCGDTVAAQTNCFEPYTPTINSVTPSSSGHPVIHW